MSHLLLSPGPQLPKFDFFEEQDKVAHFVLFAVWCFLLVPFTLKRSWLVLIIGLLVGGLTEYLQGFIPYRTSDVLDLLTDVLGVVIGYTAGFFVKKELFGAEKKFDK